MFKGKHKQELQQIHDVSCGDNNISLYKRLQMEGYWPKMAKEADDFQRSYTRCQESLDVGEYLFTQEGRDWLPPYLDFVQHLLLPSYHFDAMKFKRKFFVEEDSLFKRSFNQALLRCIMGDEVAKVFKKINAGDFGEH